MRSASECSKCPPECICPQPSHNNCWAVMGNVNLQEIVQEKFSTLQSCPQSSRGRSRHSCRQILEVRHEAVNSHDELMEERAWKAFLLLPLLLLRRLGNERKVSKEDRSWLTLAKTDFGQNQVWPNYGACVVWVVWCGVVWCGVVWCCAVWCGVVWCCAVLCGVVRCCAVLYGVVRCCAALRAALRSVALHCVALRCVVPDFHGFPWVGAWLCWVVCWVVCVGCVCVLCVCGCWFHSFIVWGFTCGCWFQGFGLVMLGAPRPPFSLDRPKFPSFFPSPATVFCSFLTLLLVLFVEFWCF